jgi:hypothetical protein
MKVASFVGSRISGLLSSKNSKIILIIVEPEKVLWYFDYKNINLLHIFGNNPLRFTRVDIRPILEE